ncbi:MAG: non-canonical purine NTP pyrophosphatase, partial [Candidatus Bipolaricaulota bacterium]
EGRIAEAPRGSGGFGYDPLLIPEGETRTLAEMNPEEKDTISHRRRALAGLFPALLTLTHGDTPGGKPEDHRGERRGTAE